MPAELLHQVRGHLEYLGYIFSTEGKSIIGTHTTKPNINVRGYKGGVLLTAAYVVKNTAEADPAGFLKFVNDANLRAAVARYVWKADEKALLVEAWHPKSYDRSAFTDFFEAWLNDASEYFTKEEQLGRTYLE